MYILGTNAVIIKNEVQVNVVHITVECKWNVSPKKLLVKKNPIRKKASSEKASLNTAMTTTPIVCISWIGTVIP